MSEVNWQKLSPEDQKIIKDAAKEVEKFVRNQAAKADQDALTELKKKGAIITDIPDKTEWQNAVKPLYQKYGAEFKGLLDSIAQMK